MRPHITVIEPEGPEKWFSALAGIADVEYFYPHGPVKPEQIDEILLRSDGVIITSATAISNEQLDRASRLKIIAKCGGPPSNIDIAHAGTRGIAITCVPRANTTSIAEYTVMLIMAALRRFDLHIGVIRQGKWRAPGFLLGHDLKDAVVGIVGLGAIGLEVARRLSVFGCQILSFSPHANRNEGSALGVTFCDSLEELLPRCDVITIHNKVTPQTTGYFNEHCFSLMKKGAVFINTARGALVDEEALSAALLNGQLSAAAVDVFQTEPPPESCSLLDCQNAILTPHSAGWTEEALYRECYGAVNSVLAFFSGNNIPGLLN
jgi:D-3-phosphoglycerate dehydrogenase